MSEMIAELVKCNGSGRATVSEGILASRLHTPRHANTPVEQQDEKATIVAGGWQVTP